MLKPLQEREKGLTRSPLHFINAAYETALPTLRMEAELKHHSGCVNHVCFSSSGVPAPILHIAHCHPSPLHAIRK
jgi:hypothetical protein